MMVSINFPVVLIVAHIGIFLSRKCHFIILVNCIYFPHKSVKETPLYVNHKCKPYKPHFLVNIDHQ